MSRKSKRKSHKLSTRRKRVKTSARYRAANDMLTSSGFDKSSARKYLRSTYRGPNEDLHKHGIGDLFITPEYKARFQNLRTGDPPLQSRRLILRNDHWDILLYTNIYKDYKLTIEYQIKQSYPPNPNMRSIWTGSIPVNKDLMYQMQQANDNDTWFEYLLEKISKEFTISNESGEPGEHANWKLGEGGGAYTITRY